MTDGLKWTNGGLEGLHQRLEAPETSVVNGIVELLEDVVLIAALDQANILDAAVTRTGERRVASGKGDHAGRHKTGEMIKQIVSSVTVTGLTVVGRWGWTDPEKYFLDQDLDTVAERIPAAHSLHGSFIRAVEHVKAGLIRLSKGK